MCVVERAWILPLFCALLLGCKSPAPSPAPEISVQRVLDARKVALTNSMELLSVFGPPERAAAYGITGMNFQKLTRELKKIRTDDCPISFQLAWSNYVRACEHDAVPLLDLKREQLGTNPLLTSARLDTEANRLGGRESAEAFVNVRQVALELGVTVPPD
jgi:hypothetical protein